MILRDRCVDFVSREAVVVRVGQHLPNSYPAGGVVVDPPDGWRVVGAWLVAHDASKANPYTTFRVSVSSGAGIAVINVFRRDGRLVEEPVWAQTDLSAQWVTVGLALAPV